MRLLGLDFWSRENEPGTRISARKDGMGILLHGQVVIVCVEEEFNVAGLVE